MKKIAIMTYHDMVNYGSFYQMFSLQEVLKEMNYEVIIINYKPNANFIKKIINNYSFLKKIWLVIKNNKIWTKFNNCYELYIRKTKVVSNSKDLLKLNTFYDIFIAGSDQIWSPNHFDIHYFLDFVDENKIRISYAPSVVIDSFTHEQIASVKKELKKYHAISVREKKSQSIIKKKMGIQSCVVLDPTLIVSMEKLNKIVANNRKLEKYDILCYFLGNNDYGNKIKGMDVDIENNKILNICIDKKNNISYADNKYDVDPRDFLQYLSNAKMIFTDSFHGVALSIKFQKQFVVFDRFKENDPICQNSRIYDLLELLDIKNVTYGGSLDKIDYEKVNDKLNSQIQRSKEFLNDSLKEN